MKVNIGLMISDSLFISDGPCYQFQTVSKLFQQLQRASRAEAVVKSSLTYLKFDASARQIWTRMSRYHHPLFTFIVSELIKHINIPCFHDSFYCDAVRIAQYFMRYYRTKHLQWLLVFRDLIQQQGQTFGSRATSQLRSQIYKSWYFSNHLKMFKSRRVLNPLFGRWLNNNVSNPLFTFLMI